MKNYQRLKGLIAATFTPMDASGNINLSIIDSYADYLADSAIAGVFVCGTTGESLSLTIPERKAILAQWVQSAKGRFKVIAHVGCNSLMEAMELAAHASKVGADAIGAMSPCFFKPANVDSLIRFFEPIAKAASELPFYFYYLPSMTGFYVTVSEFLTKGKKVIPNLVGVKFTDNNLMDMADCIALNNGEFEILHGYDEILVSGIAMGAVAGVGSTYNYIPKVYSGIFEQMEKGNLVEARRLQLQSVDIVKVIIKYGGGLRGGMAIMKLIGIDCGPCRLPVTPLTESEWESLKTDLRKLDFIDIKE